MTMLSIARTDSLIARDKRIALEHALLDANEDAGFRAGMAWAARVEREYPCSEDMPDCISTNSREPRG